MRTVLLVGPYPPPYGGLAVQLYQWQHYLDATGAYACRVLNIGDSRSQVIDGCHPVRGPLHFLQQVLGSSRAGHLIHLLTNGHNVKSWLSCLVCAGAGLLNARRSVIVLGSGNTARYLSQASGIEKTLVRLTVAMAGHLICRNEETRSALIQAGAKQGDVSIMPGFLGVESESSRSVPGVVEKFLDRHEPVLGATASIDHEYGIPMMLTLVERLRTEYPCVGLILMGPTRDVVQERYGSLPEQILVTGPLPHGAVIGTMQRLRMFLRPTAFDGDSVSVREALAVGIPVVASNVGFRPTGVALFPAGDMVAFLECVMMILSHPLKPRNRLGVQSSTTSERLLELYARLFRS